MSQTMDLESEQFMTLLTDALRAGPASPEWHQAVGVLRAAGAGTNVDEMQLLVRAREDLESGRGYRAVKAGPGFTQKVLAGIEEETGNPRRGLPSANLIAFLALGVILAVVVVVAIAVIKNTPDGNRQVEQLSSIYLVNPVAQLNFESDKEIPTEWRLVGEVPLKVTDKHLAPATTQPTKDDKREYRLGAIVLAESIAPDQARMIDVTLRIKGMTDGVIPQVFVSEGPVDGVTAAGKRELIWLLQGGVAQTVLPDLSVKPPQGEKLDLKKSSLVNVKIRFNKDTVIVDSGDKRVYEGPNQLSPAAPRYIGVRFRRKVGDGSDGVWLESVNVFKP